MSLTQANGSSSPRLGARQLATPPSARCGTGAGHLLFPLEVTVGSLASQWGKDTRPAAEVTAISHTLVKGAKIKAFDL